MTITEALNNFPFPLWIVLPIIGAMLMFAVYGFIELESKIKKDNDESRD